MRKAAILQSAYIPWRGYFSMIAAVDEFVLYDDVQFSNGDWRNRNRIQTEAGPKWVTIPVPKKGRIKQNIEDIRPNNSDWQMDHWNRIVASYAKAPFFDEIEALLLPVYQTSFERLSDVNRRLISTICDYLGIKTRLSWSTDYVLPTDRTERLVALCEQLECSTYVSGPAANAYLDEQMFTRRDIAVEWFSYGDLQQYPQIHGGFEPSVSIVDLLFNQGPEAPKYLGHNAASA